MNYKFKKFSDVEVLPGFNHVSSALFKENNLNIETEADFEKLFPDQIDASFQGKFFDNFKPLIGTEEFIEKLKNHNKNESITIFGDYDADGVMATTILVLALRNLGYIVHFAIPDRLTEGYGMQKRLVDNAVQINKSTLIITVDNGIAGKELVEYANSFGIEVIITDHHIPNENVPENSLIIDPKYNHDDFEDICGAFVAFKLAYALTKESTPNLHYLLYALAPLAGIATITDMMPMLEENRLIVNYTLDYINRNFYERKDPVRKMINSLGGSNFLKNRNAMATEELIGFYIGPAINAVSRVKGNVVELIEDILKVYTVPYAFIPIYKTNSTRQEMTKALMEKFGEQKGKDHCIVYVFNKDDFNFEIKGILGIVANQVANREKKVALIGTETQPGKYEFSGRGMAGYNLHDGIDRIKAEHPEFNIDGGGHASAMGIRIEAKDLGEVDRFAQILENDIIANAEEVIQSIFEWDPDYEVEILNTLRDLQPYGNGFHKLIFDYTGEFKAYDMYSHEARIGDYIFKLYIDPDLAKDLTGSMYNVNFTISFAEKTPIFSVLK